jgi:UDP-glucose 4-epimerase
MTTKRVLVTGASGFVGRPLVAALLRAGFAVRATTRRRVAFPDAVDARIIPDLKSPIDWAPLLRDVDVVIHAAGLAHGPVTDDKFSEFDRVNWIATEELAQAAKNAGVGQFVYISSVRAQIGASASHVVRETDEAQPTNYYGRSKLAAETAIRAAGVPFTIFRPVVIYGPNPKGNMRTLIRLAKLWLPLPIASFTSRRSLLGIDNLISAIIFALNNPAAIGGVYLLADPTPMMLGEILSVLREKLGRSLTTIAIPKSIIHVLLALIGRTDLWLRFAGDLVVDTGKFQALGWRPATDTKRGLAAMLQTEDGESAPAMQRLL